MAILIDNQENQFTVKGEINQVTCKDLKDFVDVMFHQFSSVIMNIDLVHKIDKKGFDVLTSLYQDSIKQGKSLIITGEGCKEIYDDLLCLN